jgi:hypothetical protein
VGVPPVAIPPALSEPPVDFVPPLALLPPVFTPPVLELPPDAFAPPVAKPPVFDVVVTVLLAPDTLRVPPESVPVFPAIPRVPPVSTPIINSSGGGVALSVAPQATSNNVSRLLCKIHLLVDIVAPQPQ